LKRTLIALLLAAAGSAHAAFEGPYDGASWTQILNGGSVSLSAMPDLLTMVSSDDGEGPDNTDFTITAAASGFVTFTWGYLNGDIAGSGLDPFGYLKNGDFTQLTTNDLFTPQSGTVSFEVAAGDTFGFRIFATDSILGSSTAAIYGFTAPVPEPETYALMLAGLGLVGFMARRRAAKK